MERAVHALPHKFVQIANAFVPLGLVVVHAENVHFHSLALMGNVNVRQVIVEECVQVALPHKHVQREFALAL